MSWFKKIVSRILGDELEDSSTVNTNNYNNEEQYKSLDQFENDYEYEKGTRYNEDEYIEDPYSQQKMQNVESERKRESFKFPLIPDENNIKGRVNKVPPNNQQHQQKDMDLPNWTQSMGQVSPALKQIKSQGKPRNPFTTTQPNHHRPEAYSPFVREPRGLRGVVEKTNRENYNPFNPNGTRSLKQKDSEPKQNSNLDKNVVNSKPVTPSYVPKKKKFVPTDVPSPIYGFQKRPKPGRDIYDLLNEKEMELPSKSAVQNEVAATTVAETESSISSIVKNTENTIAATSVEEENGSIHVNDVNQKKADQNVFEEEPDVVQAKVQDRQVQNAVDEHIVLEKVSIQEELQQPIDVKDELARSTETTASLVNVQVTNCYAEDNTLSNADEKELDTNPINDITDTKASDEITETMNFEKVHDDQDDVEVCEESAAAIEEISVQEPTTSRELDKYDQNESKEDHVPEIVTEDLSHEVQNSEESRETGSRIPFNVVMLKSDKLKIEQSTKATNSTLRPISAGESYLNPVQSKEESSAEKNLQQESLVSLNHDIKEVEDDEIGETTFENLVLKIEASQVEQSTPIQVDSEQQSNTLPEQELHQLNGHLEKALSYLEPPEEKTEDFEWMDAQGAKLIEALSYFQIEGEIVEIVQGPAVTQFEITVGHGVKVSKIRNLADDLKLALAAKDIRIQAPIPGKSSIGIEIPNRKSRPVRLSEVVTHESFVDSKSPLEAALGLDLTGEPVTIDLRKMPHGMIAGATGSGKSVCINSLLISLLLKASPQDVKLMLIDPKMVELAPFNHIPHLVSPVITDVKAATAALKWAVDEMDRRYQLFAHVGARDITRYNKMVERDRKFSLKMPYLVIVIDELADLMMMSPQEVEESICRIAQKARACGIHLVLATQRPSVDVITGLIKSNIPTRIAFSVSSHVDSRTILDSQGAERLLGRGDMLYLGNGMSAPVRVQGTFVTDDEIEAVTSYVRTLGEPDYLFEQEELLKKVDSIEEQDELFEEACRYICSEGSVSASSLQRKYRIGYNRAARLVDMMEAQGFISESKGTKPRDVFLTENDLEEIFGS